MLLTKRGAFSWSQEDAVVFTRRVDAERAARRVAPLPRGLPQWMRPVRVREAWVNCRGACDWGYVWLRSDGHSVFIDQPRDSDDVHTRFCLNCGRTQYWRPGWPEPQPGGIRFDPEYAVEAPLRGKERVVMEECMERYFAEGIELQRVGGVR